jgi:hypothetical protein
MEGAVTDPTPAIHEPPHDLLFNACPAKVRSTPGLLFHRLLEQAVATDPHPYKALRARDSA